MNSQRKEPEAPLCARAYLALCSIANVSRSELDGYLDEHFRGDFRKVEIFLREGKRPSVAVRDALIAFARHKLGLTLSHAWFDMTWHPSGLIDTFILQNIEYDGTLEKTCGSYFYLTRKTGTEEVRQGRILIQQHSSGMFGFLMGTNEGVAKGSHPMSGFVLGHSETIFLIGFDAKEHSKVMLAVLRRPPPNLRQEGVRLFGVQTTTIAAGHALNGRVVSKRLVLLDEDSWIQKWKDGKTPRKAVTDWLIAHESELDVPLTFIGDEEQW